MRRTSAFLAAFLISITAWYAADQATRANQFKAADLNNDGMLSSTEFGNAKNKVPASIAGKKGVSRTDFHGGMH